MQYIIKTIVPLLFLLIPFGVVAQSTYLPQGNKHQTLLNRLEILLQTNDDLNLNTVKPFSRKIAVRIAESADSIQKANGNLLSKIDEYNLRSLLMNNSEWVTGTDTSDFYSKKSLWNTFYKTKANLLEVNVKDFFFTVNPVFQQQLSVENEEHSDDQLFVNTKGLAVRGLIAKKIGFSAYITDNQERAPLFVQDRIADFNAVPGNG